MKNRFIAFLLTCFSFLIFSFQAQAQITNLKINGPANVCLGCFTYSPSFVDLNDPPTANYVFEWVLLLPGGNGFTSSQKDFTHCFQMIGTYVLYLTVQNPNGVVFSDTLTINALDFLPLQILSSNPATCNQDSLQNSGNQYCEKVCPYSTVTYSIPADLANPGGPIGTISWSVIGAQSFTVNPTSWNSSVTVHWGAAGAGSVSVVYAGSSQQSCIGEASRCVTIVEEPRADFDTDPLSSSPDTLKLCKGQTVYFENKSQYADLYEWAFSDDASTTSEANPQHTFFTPGFYTVQLVARSACLCADTTEMVIEVLDADAPTLDCVGDVCPGATVSYTASANCTGISWAVSANGTVLSGGTPTTDSITVEWGAGPAGTITLSNFSCAGNVCPQPTVVRIPIIDDNAEIRGAEQVCPDAVEVYSIEPFGGTGFQWSLSGGGVIEDGHGTNRVSVRWNGFPNPTITYWLIVKYNNCYLGCSGIDSIPVRVVSPFYVSGPVEACQNSSGTYLSRLSYNNMNLPCNWTLIGPDGSQVWASPAPAASVTAPFANGPGIYRLFAQPDNPTLSCTDQAEWAIQVPDLPVGPSGISGAMLICPGETFTYEATGVPPTANIRWEIQNGPAAPTTVFGNPVNVPWNATGPYQLTAVRMSDDGLGCPSDPVLVNLQTLSTLILNGPNTSCADQKRNYVAPLIPGLDYQWSIVPASAGTIASGQGTNQVEVFWQTPGNHEVRLDLCGKSASRTVTVNGLPAPVVNHPASLCPGATATVQTAIPYSTYSWANASGGNLGAMPTVDLGPGNYAVTITDANGCIGNANFAIDPEAEPTVTISTADPTRFCANSQTVTMRGLISSGPPLTYEWFRDGNPLGVNTPVYSTNQYGQYTLQVTNPAGCTATAGPIAVVEDCTGGGGGGAPCTPGVPCPPGSVLLQIDPSARCDSMYFSLSGPDFVVGSGRYEFAQFGALLVGTANGDASGFVFPEPGYFVVAAYAELTNGMICQILDSVRVEAVADFTPLPECPGSATNFEEHSAFLPGSGITAWNWDFGDPASGPNNTAGIQTPTHAYATGGGYSITLTVTANSGCTASRSLPASVPVTTVPAITAPAGLCAGTALAFSATGQNLNWDFGDPASGALNTASGQPVYHSFAAGNYPVTVTAEDNYGCTATSTLPVNVAPNGLSGLITPTNPAPICENSSLLLTAPPGGLSYLWSDNSTANTLTVTQEGVYTVTLTDANGCTYAPPPVPVDVAPGPDALIKALLTNDLGQIIGVAYPSHAVCAGEDVRLFAASQGSYTYSWSNGETGTNIEYSEVRNNLLPVGTHVYTVTVTDGVSGCTAVTDPFVVTVNPVPSGFSIANNTFPPCAGSANNLDFIGPTPGNWQYIWNTGETDLPLVTENPGLYFIRVINEFGCEARSNTLTVLPGPNTHAIPAGCHTRCRPDTLCLPNIPFISTWQWFFNGSPIPGANTSTFLPDQSGTYYAELTDFFGCTSQSGPLTLNLLDGYGNVLGQVWSDVNNNGVIDGADTLVSGIAVNLLDNNVPVSALWSGAAGPFAFTNILSKNYAVEIDAGLLPPGWQIVIGQDAANLSGCDAETQVGLLIRAACLDVLISAVELSACPNDGAVYNGTMIPAGTSQTFTFTSVDGCDSLVTVDVAELPTSTGTLDVSACPGTDYDYNGTMIPAGSSQQFTLQNFLGCDSLLTVNVAALPTSTGTLDVSACPGTDYDFNGTMIPAGSSQQFTLQNYLGCDSLLTVNVAALPTSTGTLDVSACPGTDYDFNGTMIPAGTSQQFTLQNYLGCDSLLTVNVAALPTSTGTLDVSACPGTDYDYNGTMIPAGTSQQFTLQNFLGCDSLLTVNVATLPTSTGTLDVSACPGTDYDFNGTMIPAGSSQQFTLQNFLGCDSLLTVNVAIAQTSASTMRVSLCPGETFPYQGSVLQIGDTQDFTLQNAVGCDSVVTVVVSGLTTTAETLDVSVCPGTAYLFDGVELQAGDSRVFKYTNSDGCDSLVTVTVSAFPTASFALAPKASCQNIGTGILEVQNPSGGLPPYQYSLDGSVFQTGAVFSDLMPGSYTVWMEDGNGCLFTADTLIPARTPLAVALQDAVLSCDSVGVMMTPLVGGDQTNLAYTWYTGEQTPAIAVYNPGPVWVEVQNACETQRAEAEAKWADVGADFSFVYVPNVFAPQSMDPDNAQFRPYFAPELLLRNYKFEIFDRWGNKMFSTKDPQDGWTGPFRDERMQPAVFVWYMLVDIDYCGRVLSLKREGDVTVVR
ncbi:MAG: PKD domain-containing protein [Lewinellaceae bacterium]|nr:PKD domain-containing protein [Lewinellaceae bacterium]